MKCTPSHIYSILTDVPNWQDWDPDLKYAEITSKPSIDTLEGATGVVHMKNERSFDFTIHDLQVNSEFRYFSFICMTVRSKQHQTDT